jgi:hypothetical protein
MFSMGLTMTLMVTLSFGLVVTFALDSFGFWVPVVNIYRLVFWSPVSFVVLNLMVFKKIMGPVTVIIDQYHFIPFVQVIMPVVRWQFRCPLPAAAMQVDKLAVWDIIVGLNIREVIVIHIGISYRTPDGRTHIDIYIDLCCSRHDYKQEEACNNSDRSHDNSFWLLLNLQIFKMPAIIVPIVFNARVWIAKYDIKR